MDVKIQAFTELTLLILSKDILRCFYFSNSVEGASLIFQNMSSPQINMTLRSSGCIFWVLGATGTLFVQNGGRHWVSYFYFWFAIVYWLINSEICWMYNSGSTWFCNKSSHPLPHTTCIIWFFLKWYIKKAAVVGVLSVFNFSALDNNHQI